MENMSIISVFKTNLAAEDDHVCTAVQGLPGVHRCTLDAEDCDKVLRIEGHAFCPDRVLDTVRGLGFFIEEMPD